MTSLLESVRNDIQLLINERRLQPLEPKKFAQALEKHIRDFLYKYMKPEAIDPPSGLSPNLYVNVSDYGDGESVNVEVSKSVMNRIRLNKSQLTTANLPAQLISLQAPKPKEQRMSLRNKNVKDPEAYEANLLRKTQVLYELISNISRRYGWILLNYRLLGHYEGAFVFQLQPNYGFSRVELGPNDNLYRLGPVSKDSTVLRKGFIPASGYRGSINYPNRVYMFTDLESAKEYYVDVLRSMHNIESFSVYKIDTAKLPKSVKMYNDTEIPENKSVWTYSRIPPEAISKVGEIVFGDKEKFPRPYQYKELT